MYLSALRASARSRNPGLLTNELTGDQSANFRHLGRPACGGKMTVEMFGSGTALSARPTENLQHRLQFAGLKHFHHDVAAADEGLVDVELGDRRPVAEALDAFADLRILNHVD